MSILLVEDSERIRTLVRAILSAVPSPLIEADSAEGALALIESDSDRFELLITDLAMPGLSGLELATRLRARNPDLPVLCMSGHTLPSGAAEGIHFIEKPFRPDEFLLKVRGLLSN
jgi:DNA-binding response OmpR family regulator